jgi:hypothetical protein
MKPLVSLLAASLVANAVFIAVQMMRPSPAKAHDVSSTSPATISASSHAAKPDPALTGDIVAALKANDAEGLRDLLRTAGLPDETVRAVVSSTIWGRYRDRINILQPKPDPNAPWWKQEQDWWGNKLTREQRAEMRRLQREATDESIRLLGPDKDPRSGWQDPRFGFLTDAKRKDVQEIEQDYQDLLQEAQQDMQGFTLPSDVEKIRFLQEEKKRDIAALLTPQELADYELRMSPTAQQLRWKMAKFDGTEEEYRKIFAVQQAYDSTQQFDAWGNPLNTASQDWEKHQQAQKQVNAQIKDALGSERYADYMRSQNHEYQQLATAAKRLSLPPETAIQVFNLRHELSSESQRIADNANLTTEQKKQALVALSKKTRDQVRASLGNEASEVYLKSSMSWLNSLEHGNLVTFSEEGQHTGSRSLPPDKKLPAPKP